MSLEERLRQMVTALPDEASVMLQVAVVCGSLNEESDDSLADLTVTTCVTINNPRGNPT